MGLTMDKVVSAADAKRKLSQLLQKVRRGRSYVVTSHGKPVARISPVDEAGRIEAGARATLLVRLRSQSVTKALRWTRDNLYDPR
jgi:prevent-host-death family protein